MSCLSLEYDFKFRVSLVLCLEFDFEFQIV